MSVTKNLFNLFLKVTIMDGRDLAGRFNKMIRQKNETCRIQMACDLLVDVLDKWEFDFLCITMKYKIVMNYIAAILGIIRPEPTPVQLGHVDQRVVQRELTGLFFE